MQCAECGHQNPVGTKFCGGCGTKLTLTCAACGASNPAGNKFCGECGTLLGQASPIQPISTKFASPQAYTPRHLAERILSSKGALEGERKQVTVLFADLKGSMELLAGRDPEEARALLDPVLERMMEAIHHYEGTVNQVMGDGIMALFGAPLAHEDHAVRACYAALRMQETVKRYAEEVRRGHGAAVHIRIGLNSGEVVVRSIGSDLHMDYTAVGQTTHLAARMEQMAMPGSVLMTPETLRFAEGFVEVKPLGAATLKGLDETVQVYELSGAASARSRLQVAAGRGLTRFVGRDTELAQLQQALQRAGSGNGQVVALVGEPGVGKSRLVWEFIRSHRTAGWLILESGSVSYGRATPYLPVIDLVKAYCKIEDRDDQRAVREKVTGKLLTLDRALEPLLPAFFALLDVPVEDGHWQGLDPRQRRERTLEAVKRLLIRESQVQQLLLVFEDLHWIDTETQALLDSLVESLPTTRVLLLVNYRPEYQHGWSNKTYYTQLRLDPLPPESVDELLHALVGKHETLDPLKPVLIARTEGNPFFLEESVRTLVETKALLGERGAYRLDRPLASVQIPATVQAMLAARVDRLSPDDKRLLQSASVIGKDVPLIILQAAVEMPEGELHAGLARLQAAEFMYETSIFPDREYTFKHALTHEVTYNSLLRERRRELHRRAGEAVEHLFAERREEFSSLLARHFLECGDLRKALAYAMQAAEKAERLFAHEEALRHYERARTCAEGLHFAAEIATIDEGIGDVYFRRGLFDRAVSAYERATASAAAPDTRAALKFKIGRVYGQFGDQRGLQFLETALADLNPSTQQKERAEATALLGRYQHYGAQHGRAIELLEEALRLAAPLADAGTHKTIYRYLSGAYFHMGRPEESMEWARRCVELGERTEDPSAVAAGFEHLAENLGLLGRWDESLEFCAREYEVATRIGSEHNLTWVEYDRAVAIHGKGDLPTAAAAARAGLVLAEKSGEKRIAALLIARLAEVETDLGSDVPAQSHAEAGVATADAIGDRVTHAGTRYAAAYYHLQRGEWHLAAVHFDQIRELLAGCDNRFALIISGAGAAEAAWGAGRFDEAAKLAVEALELARRAGSRHYEALALRVQGQILASQDSAEAASQVFDQAIAILAEMGSRLELGRALYQRGLLRRRLGAANEAQVDLVRARAIFDESGARRDRERAESVLSSPPEEAGHA